MKRLAIIATFVCECAFAQSDYYAVLTNMVTALEQTRGTLDATFTNQLAVCAEATTNVCHLANMNLVWAIALADIAEDDLSGDIVLPQAISLCSNILASVELPQTAWQRGAASTVMSAIHGFDGKPSLAVFDATNSISTAYNVSLAEDAYLWNAMAKHLYVDGVSVRDALRCYAAIAIVGNDSTQEISSYTNGLPESILVKIRELAE